LTRRHRRAERRFPVRLEKTAGSSQGQSAIPIRLFASVRAYIHCAERPAGGAAKEAGTDNAKISYKTWAETIGTTAPKMQKRPPEFRGPFLGGSSVSQIRNLSDLQRNLSPLEKMLPQRTTLGCAAAQFVVHAECSLDRRCRRLSKSNAAQASSTFAPGVEFHLTTDGDRTYIFEPRQGTRQNRWPRTRANSYPPATATNASDRPSFNQIAASLYCATSIGRGAVQRFASSM